MTPDVMENALAFGRFELRLRERLLLTDGVAQDLGARAFDLLVALVRSNGALVTKDALLRAAWPGSIVEENNLHAQIAAIRRVLGPDRDAIITVTGRGYRFALPVVPRQDRAARALPRFALAILPFQATPQGTAAEILAEGVTESLTTDLARSLGAAAVVSGASGRALLASTSGTRQAARERGVRYVLEGRIVASTGRVRVNVQLIDSATDVHVWAERFDQDAEPDPMAVQDIIVGRLSRQVTLRMVLAEARRAATGAPDAAGLALQGYGAAIMSRMVPAGVPVARALFHRALALDPDSIEAAAGLAAIEAYSLVNGFTPAAERAERLAEADALSRRVLAAEPEHLGALRARAVVLRAQGWFSDAIVCGKTILTVSPRDPPASREIGLNHLYLGGPDEALVWFRRAEESGPSDPARWSWMQGMGRALLQLGRVGEAVEALRVVVEGNPDWAFGHGLLAAALLLQGDDDAAEARFAEFVHRLPEAAARVPDRLVQVQRDLISEAYHRHDAPLRRALGELELRIV
jgi:TolB-like protein/tetratricopeptide (TPR) repeat protein